MMEDNQQKGKERSDTHSVLEGTKENSRMAVAMNVYRFVYLIYFLSTNSAKSVASNTAVLLLKVG
jgi:hypothetical protein